MNNGAERWARLRAFYAGLTLVSDGVGWEQEGAVEHHLDKLFPNYERFWKYHVCPGTDRPTGMDFLAATGETISVMMQRSYTVFMYVTEAVEHLKMVTAGDLGRRYRHCFITLTYAGNALQIFTELQRAVCGEPTQRGGIASLSAILRPALDPFPDWEGAWAARRSGIARYRNYLTHQGLPFVVTDAVGTPHVLKRECVPSRRPLTWRESNRRFDDDITSYTTLAGACEQIVADTIAFLNDGYGRICDALEPLLSDGAYQSLWGWRDGCELPAERHVSAVSNPRPTLSDGTELFRAPRSTGTPAPQAPIGTGTATGSGGGNGAAGPPGSGMRDWVSERDLTAP